MQADGGNRSDFGAAFYVDINAPAKNPIVTPPEGGIPEDFIAAGWTMDEVTLAIKFRVDIKPYIASTVEPGAFRTELNGCPISLV